MHPDNGVMRRDYAHARFQPLPFMTAIVLIKLSCNNVATTVITVMAYLAPAAAFAILSLATPALKLLLPPDPATNLDACCTTSRHRYLADALDEHCT